LGRGVEDLEALEVGGLVVDCDCDFAHVGRVQIDSV
jgi:hypothetical protein